MQNDKFYKGKPPVSADDDWIDSAEMIGDVGWDNFTRLFFMASGELYGVNDDKFYKSPPASDDSVNWIQDLTCIGSCGWSPFKFLISPLRTANE